MKTFRNKENWSFNKVEKTLLLIAIGFLSAYAVWLVIKTIEMIKL